MAIKVLETKKSFIKRCTCGALLQFEKSDLHIIECGKSGYEYYMGYLYCPVCKIELCVGELDRLK